MHQEFVKGRALWLGSALVLCAAAAVFGMYAYNSGYGFDALEYLLIGRSLVDGYAFYSFVPSKSWGLYALVAAYFRLGGPMTHTGVSVLVATLFACVTGATYAAAGKAFGRIAAITAGSLVALCAAFMELNFLEPEPLVYLSGLLAWAVLNSNGIHSPRRWLAAGALLGVGCAFKMVALFYLIGAFVYLLWAVAAGQSKLRQAIPLSVCLLAGWAIVLLPQALYFAATGRFQPFVEWTFTHPLFHYPSNRFFLDKLYTKLLWFFLLLSGAIAMSLQPGRRSRLALNQPAVLALCFGLAAFGSLFKSQASHYVFPGAAMCVLFISAVAQDMWQTTRLHAHAGKAMLAGLAGILVILVSAWLYSPSALRRVFEVHSFQHEDQFQADMRRLLPPGGTILAVNDGRIAYWLTHTYPPVPIIDTENQTSAYLRTHPDTLTNALNEPKLQLVDFDPEHPALDDPYGLTYPHVRAALARFTAALPANFERQKVNGRVYWLRGQPPARLVP